MSYSNIFSRIYETWGFGGDESRSGPGSTLYETRHLRQKILDSVKNKNIKSVVDIPCGDFNWMKEIVNEFDFYIGGDIVEKCIETNRNLYGTNKVNFINIDIMNDQIPKADLLIVRDLIGHYPLEDGKKIIDNILKSECKFLLSTTWYNIHDREYHLKHENREVSHGRFYPVNLMSEPFNLSEPIFIIEENVEVEDYDKGNRKVLALWDLSNIKKKMKLR